MTKEEESRTRGLPKCGLKCFDRTFVLSSTVVILLNFSTTLNICASKSVTFAKPKTVNSNYIKKTSKEKNEPCCILFIRQNKEITASAGIKATKDFDQIKKTLNGSDIS
jgi:hypothetical protein